MAVESDSVLWSLFLTKHQINVDQASVLDDAHVVPKKGGSKPIEVLVHQRTQIRWWWRPVKGYGLGEKLTEGKRSSFQHLRSAWIHSPLRFLKVSLASSPSLLCLFLCLELSVAESS